MSGTSVHKEDEVLKRMLNTPHRKHEPTKPRIRERRRQSEGKAKD